MHKSGKSRFAYMGEIVTLFASLSFAQAAPPQATPLVDRPAATPYPSLDLSLQAAKAALHACEGQAAIVAIVDSAGELKLELAGDGATPLGVELALRKARTAAIFKMPSSQSKADHSLAFKLSSSLYTYYGGGLPLIASDGTVFGGIGVSGGGSEAGEETCARAGVDKIASQLK